MFFMVDFLAIFLPHGTKHCEGEKKNIQEKEFYFFLVQ